MKAILRTFLVLSLLAAFGCSVVTQGYPGEARDHTELATVYSYGVTLHEVNGMKIGSDSRAVEVLAGRNDFALTTNPGNYQMIDSSRATYRLSTNLKAGARYHITSKRGNPAICAYRVDDLTGQPNFQDAAGCVVRQ